MLAHLSSDSKNKYFLPSVRKAMLILITTSQAIYRKLILRIEDWRRWDVKRAIRTPI